ncbi:MAG: hypothetical protein ACO25N_01705 [Candidatus Limnocylindrus sp.]|jgi:hypothetical protein|nr:hypothetical protein [Candidatus Aquidulcis sp.]
MAGLDHEERFLFREEILALAAALTEGSALDNVEDLLVDLITSSHFDAEVVTLERSLQAMLGQRQGSTLVTALTAAPEVFDEVTQLRLPPEVVDRLAGWRARFGLAIDNALSFLSNPDGIQGHNFTTQVAHADDRRTLQGRLTFVRYSNESEFFIADANVFVQVAADLLDKLGTHISREDVDQESVTRLKEAVDLIERRTAPRDEA